MTIIDNMIVLFNCRSNNIETLNKHEFLNLKTAGELSTLILDIVPQYRDPAQAVI